jgi:succinate-semialdehyde dehydrogenase/glutarate-semialdehyde dehydrogenase
MSYPNTQLLIDGQWQDAADGRTLPVFNPATGAEIGRVAHAGIADLDRALAAAQKGFEAWRDVPAIERGRIMRRAAGLMRERADGIAAALTQENGKPLAEAKIETMAAADIIEWFADEGMRVYGRIVPTRNPAVRQLVVKDPVGPVAAFTPWNFPINQAVRKVSAALHRLLDHRQGRRGDPGGAGRAAARLRRCGRAGRRDRPGVWQPGRDFRPPDPHPVIRKISFTGSTVVGKQLAALAGQHMKRVTMELGGHAPVIVAEDADLELAVKSSGAAKFRNAGQVCISPTRFLVHESIRNDFAAALARHAQSLKVGDGLAEGTQMGPLANPRRIVAMAGMLEDASSAARRWPPAARASARRQLLRAHGAHRRAAGRPRLQRRALRPGGGDPRLQHARRSHRRGQPPALRPRRLRLHPLAEERPPAQPAGRGGHVVDQPARAAAARDALRRRQGLRLRLGGRPGALEAYLNSRAVSIANV